MCLLMTATMVCHPKDDSECEEKAEELISILREKFDIVYEERIILVSIWCLNAGSG